MATTLHFDPAYSLIEALMHELANPVQSARTTLRLWQSDTSWQADPQNRVQGLDTAFEQIAAVLRCVQASKDSSLVPPSGVTSDKLLSDLLAECADCGLKTRTELWPEDPVTLQLHGAAIPFLIAGWAGVSRTGDRSLQLSLVPSEFYWKLIVRLRESKGDTASKPGTAEAVAGFPAAIGAFMVAAGGEVIVREDNQSAYELDLSIREWTRSE